jgi:hypothetical protein
MHPLSSLTLLTAVFGAKKSSDLNFAVSLCLELLHQAVRL